MKTAFTFVLAICMALLSNLVVFGQEEKLEIEGAIQLSNSDDPSPDPGTIRWTGSDFEGWDGNQWISLSGSAQVIDEDGNIYNTVKIGTQVWMQENLKTTKYSNGDDIPDGSTKGDISGDSDPKYWFAHSNDVNNVSIYGRLYTWDAVADNRNICPTGWHVPEATEYTTLINFLGGTGVAGGKMKVTGETRWDSPNFGADNTSKFTALPGGFRPQNGWSSLPDFGIFWTKTEAPTNPPHEQGVRLTLSKSNDNATLADVPQYFGQYVRCIKN